MTTENNTVETNVNTHLINNDELFDLISLYLDGETSPKEGELVEFLLKTDPFAQDTYSALAAVSQQIRTLPQFEPPVTLRTNIQMATTRRLPLSKRALMFGKDVVATLSPAKSVLVNVTAGLCILSLGILSINLLSKPDSQIKTRSDSHTQPRQVAVAVTPIIQQAVGSTQVISPKINDTFRFSSHPVASKTVLSFKVSHGGRDIKDSVNIPKVNTHLSGTSKSSSPTIVQAASWHSYTPSPQTDEMNTPMLSNATLDVPIHSDGENASSNSANQTTTPVVVMAGKFTGNSQPVNQHLIQESPQAVPQPKMLTTLHMKWKPVTLAVISLSSSEIAERNRPVEVNVFATHF